MPKLSWKYQKIMSIYKRDEKTKEFIIGQYSTEEIKYLKDNIWQFTEKVDGCLHYSQVITTDKGDIPIGKIVNNKLPVNVLSFNSKTLKVEYKPIEYYHKEKNIKGFVNVEIKSKFKGNKHKKIICTDNHKFYSNKQWVEAKNLKNGQIISHLSERLPEELRQLILGTLLGDSSIYRPSKKTRGFSFIHSIIQKDYFNYKKILLGKIFNEGKGYRGGFDGSKKNKRGNSIVNNAISDLILNYCEKNNKKQITKQWANELLPIGIAFWYMDDGSVNFNDKQRARARFATNAFNNSEVKLLQKMFKIKYNIDSKIFDYKGNTLCLSADSSEKLFSIIFPYICNSMKYKIPSKYRNFKCIFLNKTFDVSKNITDTTVISVTKNIKKRIRKREIFQYDLSIKDNSNYFTKGILVHNTNIRVKYNGKEVVYAGRSDEAHLPVSLIYKLDEIFKSEEGRERLRETFDYATEEMEVYLYGEGYGAKIQAGGGNYIKDGVDFVLFDVMVGYWQLDRNNVNDIAKKLNIKSIPIIGEGTLDEAIEMTKKGFKSDWGDFIAEGIVARPKVEIFTKKRDRIITKVKYCDFHKSVNQKQSKIIRDKRKYATAII